MMADAQKAVSQVEPADHSVKVTVKPQDQNPYVSVVVLDGAQW
jgi:hypothetical protein